MVTLNATWGAGRGSVLRLLAAVALLGWASSAGAQLIKADTASSDLPAGYIVFPKIVVHTTGSVSAPVLPGGTAVDTLIQLTNTDETSAINVNCWWVNANSHFGGCSSGPIISTDGELQRKQEGRSNEGWRRRRKERKEGER